MSRASDLFTRPTERVALALLWIYRRMLGPSMHASVPGTCCFQPTCSEYAAIAITEHGVVRGAAMAAWRVLRCHPLSRGRFDPVPAKRTSRAGFNGISEGALRHEWTSPMGSKMTGPHSSGVR